MTPRFAEDIYRQQRCHKKNIKKDRMIHVLRKECEGIKQILQGELQDDERQSFQAMLEENREVLHALTA